jgi:hypothetical protein
MARAAWNDHPYGADLGRRPLQVKAGGVGDKVAASLVMEMILAT